MSDQRQYDLVLYGATGYTGGLVLDYVSKQQHKLKYAIAGRSKAKLEALTAAKHSTQFGIVIADSDNEEALRKLAKSTRCVISTVGPFALYGKLLFKVCAEEGTHYLDLTGETLFESEMYQLHHETAKKNKAIMLCSVGFDSLPADLNACLAVRALQKKGAGVQVGRVQAAYKVKGGVSGGTLASMSEFIALPNELKSKVAKNPYILSPVKGNAKRSMSLVTNLEDGDRGSIWVMAPVNERNVYRTFGLLEEQSEEEKYGKNFAYEEHLAMGSYLSALITSSAMAIFFGLLHLSWIRPYLVKLVTDESESSRTAGYTKVKTTAVSTDGRHRVASVFKANADPGYTLTALMIAECAFALLLDGERLPALGKQGGALTGITAIGPEILKERLTKTGIVSFELDENPNADARASKL